MYKAVLRNVFISPRKARLVVDMVRGKSVSDALDLLKFMNKKVAPKVRKTIKSAMANAMQKQTVDIDALVVAKVFVDDGPTMYRYTPRAQGRACPIRRRSAHITVVLDEIL